VPKIFISYRRDDSQGYAGHIYERLAMVFGADAVFMDVDDIAPGTDFVRTLENSVGSCDVMLALIGNRWFEAKDAAGRRRIDDPQDFVRAEIAGALERNVRIIPVLLNNASMPSEKDLPKPLRRLAHYQAIEVGNERWDYDMEQLERALRGEKHLSGRRRSLVKAAAIAAVVLSVAVAMFLLLEQRSRPGISGRWVADVRYDFGARHSETFVFQLDGQTVTGTASFLKIDRAIIDGKFDGNRISFSTRSQELVGGATFDTKHLYRGTVGENEIRLVMQTEGGVSEHVPVEFVATR